MRTEKRVIALCIALSALAWIFASAWETGFRADTAQAAETARTRPFDMALGTFPRDFTPEAIVQTYDFVRDHADMVAHHIDKGVPWPEAFAGEPFHERVTRELQFRKHYLQGMPVYLAVSAINTERTGLNGYWAEGDRDPRPGEWRDKDFDDPDIITAFVAYCEALISELDPQVMLYGIEANMLAEKTPGAFEAYLEMSSQVYARLKERHPDLMLGVSLHYETLVDGGPEQTQAVERLLAASDMIAVSTYPYLTISAGRFGARHLEAGDFPEDWLSNLRALAPDKPLIVAETAFPAERFEVGGVDFEGSVTRQQDYMELLLERAAELDARTVIWFLPMDYDPFYEKLPAEAQDLFRLFRDTGLADGDGEPRPALEVWEQWRALPVER